MATADTLLRLTPAHIIGTVLERSHDHVHTPADRYQFSLGRKWGTYQAISTSAADGILASLTSVGTPAALTTTVADGRGIRFVSGTTTGDNAGLRNASHLTMRGWNPAFRCRFRINQTNIIRAYVGFTSATGLDLSGDDPLNALSGLMLMKRSADTKWQIAANDASGVTTFTNTNIDIDTSIHTIDVIADDSSSIFFWSFDGTDYSPITSNIPTQSAGLGWQGQVETNHSGVAKSIDVYYIEVTSDK